MCENFDHGTEPNSTAVEIRYKARAIYVKETPDAWQQIEVSGEGLSLPIVHEVEDLLSFDEEQCEDNQDYIYDQCKLSNIRKVRL